MSIRNSFTPHWTDTVTNQHSTIFLSTIISPSSLPRRSSSLIALYPHSPLQLVTPHRDSVVSVVADQYPKDHQLPNSPLLPSVAEATTARSTRYYVATDGSMRSPQLMSEDTARGSMVSNYSSAQLFNRRSSTGWGMTSPMTSPSSSKMDFGFALRREGSTGSGRALCMSPSARSPRFTINHSGREGTSSKPRRRLLTSSLFSTLSLDFEIEKNSNGEGTKNGMNGITLFDKEDIARLSMIVGRNPWNEESDVGFEASKSVSQTDVQGEILRPETEPPPPLEDTLNTEERVKPELRGAQNVAPSQLATQLQPITEKCVVMWQKELSPLLTMLRSEEMSDCTAKHTLNEKSITETLRDSHQPRGSTQISAPLETPIAKLESGTPKVLGETSTQCLAVPIPPIPPSPTPLTRKRTTRLSIFPVILPEGFPVSALIRRAHIRRRTRVQAARIRPLPPLPCATGSPPSRKPSQRSILSIAREPKVRPLPALPFTILEGSDESDCRSCSTGPVVDTWKGGPERQAIASALKLSTDLSFLRLKLELEKHDEHFLYDPQLFPRPSTSTTPNMNPTEKPLTATSLPITPSSLVTTSPTSGSPLHGVSSPTTMTRQRRSSAPDRPTLPPSGRHLTHARSRSAQIKNELRLDSGAQYLTALRMPHPPSSFRGVGRGVTKADDALTPTEYIQASSTSTQVSLPSGSSSSSRGENEPTNQNKQLGPGPHSRVFIDRSVPDTPVSGWFGRVPGRAPTPIDWELLDIVLGTKGMGRRSYSSMKTLESLDSIPRSRKDSNTTIASHSSRSRSRRRSKRKSTTPFGFRKISGSRLISFGREEIPPLPPTSRTWA